MSNTKYPINITNCIVTITTCGTLLNTPTIPNHHQDIRRMTMTPSVCSRIVLAITNGVHVHVRARMPGMLMLRMDFGFHGMCSSKTSHIEGLASLLSTRRGRR